MICRELIELLEKKYPPSIAESWDNPGLQVSQKIPIICIRASGMTTKIPFMFSRYGMKMRSCLITAARQRL